MPRIGFAKPGSSDCPHRLQSAEAAYGVAPIQASGGAVSAIRSSWRWIRSTPSVKANPNPHSPSSSLVLFPPLSPDRNRRAVAVLAATSLPGAWEEVEEHRRPLLRRLQPSEQAGRASRVAIELITISASRCSPSSIRPRRSLPEPALHFYRLIVSPSADSSPLLFESLAAQP
ncbi:hypothetical protein TRIUR3_17252 [Triticum urartu]|uniref:Uncharacterized protein n=1 Tax=Triticum urartu TaxID=4572 RepID=M8B0V6_TRIUA|nr:hypothetical protein TRIUR3_17252 [Triticum urartu]